MKSLKYISISFAILVTIVSLKAQNIEYSRLENVNKGDSVVIRLNDYIGEIQWQKSLNMMDWETITNATYDTLLIIPDTSALYRGKVTVNGCNPFYSDTVFLQMNSAITYSFELEPGDSIVFENENSEISGEIGRAHV